MGENKMIIRNSTIMTTGRIYVTYELSRREKTGFILLLFNFVEKSFQKNISHA